VSSAFTAELYAHAIATEHEAARRYAQLAERMAQQDDATAAALFHGLAQAEARRLADLRRESAGLELPDLSADHSWRMEGCDPLQIALRAEKAARAFFEQAARTAADPAVRALALEMAAEEAAHADQITRLAAQR
jgi:rubrerythrin